MSAAADVADGLSREATLGRQIAALERELVRQGKPQTHAEWIQRFRLQEKIARLRIERAQLPLFGHK